MEFLKQLEQFNPVTKENTQGRVHPHLPSPGEYTPVRYWDDDNITRMWESPIGPNPSYFPVNSVAEARDGERKFPRNSDVETANRNAMKEETNSYERS